MGTIGFSTGSLALGDVRTALEVLNLRCTGAVELSALRMHELQLMLESIPQLHLV